MQDAGNPGRAEPPPFFLTAYFPQLTLYQRLDGMGDAVGDSQADFLMNSPRHICLVWYFVALLVTGGSVTAGIERESVAASADGWVQLSAQIDRNVDAGTRLLAAAREQLEYANEEIRTEFTQMEKTVRAAEARLRRSLKSAANASPEDWARARAALAANYESYSQAVGQVERLLPLLPSGGARTPPPR